MNMNAAPRRHDVTARIIFLNKFMKEKKYLSTDSSHVPMHVYKKVATHRRRSVQKT